jgi:hypothetical protein
VDDVIRKFKFLILFLAMGHSMPLGPINYYSTLGDEDEPLCFL